MIPFVRLLLIAFGLSVSSAAYAQLLTWSPAFPGPNDPINITVDGTKGNKGLIDYTGNVYVHLGVITSASKNASDWKYTPFTWGGTATTSQAVVISKNKWQYTIANIRTFFNVPVNEEIIRIAIIFRQGGCANCAAHRNADGSDMYVKISQASMQLRFSKPDFLPLYHPIPEPIQRITGEPLFVNVINKESATVTLFLNGVNVLMLDDTTSLSHTFNIDLPGYYTITATAINRKGVSAIDSFSFSVSGGGPPETKPIPNGVRPGVNRLPGDTSVILALVAPFKNKVSVLGDFPNSDWKDNINYQMHLAPDLKTWWLQINGLQPNLEYSYQYLVDGTIKIADPYAEKILDPTHDGTIALSTYPQLKPYPVNKTTGIVSVVQSNASHYVWKNRFTRPDKSQLIIYELLLRDFLSTHDFNTLTDTLNYLASLGVNAIELMPIQEFDGNQSWGYNPAFFFAPDKYYGPAQSLKRLIDSCHGRGIAVILDMVLNHATGACPLASLYWDGVNQRPAADNPWFNVTARHPFNVFNDFNHESTDTRYFSTRVMEYWLKEYQIDGYRFDLSKGFTQKNNPNDVNAWSAYDASRVAIWRMYHDSIQRYSPGAYTILEHFAVNAEEFALADAGMLLWGNANGAYNEGTMGFVAGSNFENSLYQARGWSKPHLVSYMESHDEERLMYKNLQFGNSSGTYSTRNLSTALDRMKLAASFFLMTPGPKMIWQFGELGYDYSINTCTNGTVNSNCRLDNKPIPWPYTADPNRNALRDWYKKLLTLRKSIAWQNASLRVSYGLAGAVKWLGYNANDDLNVMVIGNFDVQPVTSTIGFPITGTWIDLKDKSILNVPQNNINLTLLPGEYHVYLDRPFDQISTTYTNNPITELDATIAPNPADEFASIQLRVPTATHFNITIHNLNGQLVHAKSNYSLTAGGHRIRLPSELQPGIYFIKLHTRDSSRTLKFIKY